MEKPASDSRFDAIETNQSLLRAAHQGSVTAAGPARNALVMRYARAIRSYLGGLLRDDADADEVAQEVVVKMLKGDFAGVNPERGRFRDYLKVSVRNAAFNFLKRKNPSGRVNLDPAELAREEAAAEKSWLRAWRQAILDRAQQALEAYQTSHPGNVYATVLHLAVKCSEEDSEVLAARLSAVVGRPYRADAARKQLSRARRKFAELLADEVRRTLDDPTIERVWEELTEIGLMPYIRSFLPPEIAPAEKRT